MGFLHRLEFWMLLGLSCSIYWAWREAGNNRLTQALWIALGGAITGVAVWLVLVLVPPLIGLRLF